MKDVLQFLLASIVDHPDDIVLEERVDGDAVILTIRANPEDYGKIIGKSGRIIRAIRDLMKVLAAKRNMYVDVEIADNQSTPAYTADNEIPLSETPDGK